MPNTYITNVPTIGGDENTWGAENNANWDLVDDLLDGTTAIKPNLSSGLWKVGGVAVTSTAAELNILDGVTASAAELNITDGLTATTAELNKLAGTPAGLTATEIGYLDGVTSAIQTQLNAKQATITTLALANGGTGASLVDPNADRLMFWDDSAGAVAFLTPGDGLSISGTTMTASVGWVYAGAYTTINAGGIEVTKTQMLSASGLTDLNDIYVQCVGLTSTGAGARSLRVSSDGGSTFLSTSIYLPGDDNGTLTTIQLSGSTTTSARNGYCEIIGFNTTNPVKPVRSTRTPESNQSVAVISSASALDAIRVYDSAGNINAGTVYVWARL